MYGVESEIRRTYEVFSQLIEAKNIWTYLCDLDEDYGDKWILGGIFDPFENVGNYSAWELYLFSRKNWVSDLYCEETIREIDFDEWITESDDQMYTDEEYDFDTYY